MTQIVEKNKPKYKYKYQQRDTASVSYRMSRVRSKDSKMELVLRKALWALGLRYRKHYKRAIGNPDIAFVGKKVAVFCDSSFWHGLDLEAQKEKLHHNREYWIEKIERNMARDQYVNERLSEAGWLVIRCSDKEIFSNTSQCVQKICKALAARHCSC